MTFVCKADLLVAEELADFIERRALAGTGIDATSFWQGAARIFRQFAGENAALLARREALQARIDAWFGARESDFDRDEHRAFLQEIGYLAPEPAPFTIANGAIDPEICSIAGPQLVVPALNARYLLNAANARWGSLYDALYGTDAIAGDIPRGGYDPARGSRVIDAAKTFLDEALSLKQGSWRDARGALPELADPGLLVGRRGESALFRHHGLHIELVIDRNDPIGRTDPLGIADIVLEAATSTIVDLEDSVAAVDAADKVLGYSNWLGALRGDLQARFDKDGTVLTRRLAQDRAYTAPDGSSFTLPGRSLLLVRNVGHLMTTPAVRLPDGDEAPEGILDAIVTVLCGMHDLHGLGAHRNSRAGAIYVVKPKQHGPEEARFTDRLFATVEDLLGLDRHTVKIGLMDEERRTSANLAACIEALKDRIFFINTGFLDRTGDEIRTSTRAGAMVPKTQMKNAAWLQAYERRNVAIGLACGFAGKAQIGKGMWAAPDRMADLIAQKGEQLRAGATTAWVPSPTAAVLHAQHYHLIDVSAQHARIAAAGTPSLDELLIVPVASPDELRATDIAAELRANAQSILGYVVRWIDQGVGCSKVPDIDDVGLMEDRATLRISAQSLANWLGAGLVSEDQVHSAFTAMAAKVDAQNAGDPSYRPMAGREAESLAFQAALALVFEATEQANGYTEPVLHRYRVLAEARDAARASASTNVGSHQKSGLREALNGEKSL
ncbi:MAG: malate synthase G [Altererythrobacter sp.]|nr:malate synthase G [Altererythrobacter sp.]OJU59524.1 MAG: malate synthase G [Altererythrobacter sp. 66-12]